MVSVIVPNYNHEAFLRKRLDSIFNQTYTDFEIILLDDCSTDGSFSILEEYSKRPQVSHFVVNDANSGGPFHQWKKGLELAQGDYIWIAESDDYNSEDFLERLMPHFNQRGVGVVFSSLNIVQNGHRKLYEALEEGYHDGRTLLSSKMITGNLFVNANCIVFEKKNVDIKKISKIKDFKICGDWLFWNHLLYKKNVYFVKEPLSFYRKHGNATTENLYNNKTFYEEASLVSKICINNLGDFYHHNARALKFYSRLIDTSDLSETDKLQLSRLLLKRFQANKFKNLYRRFIRKIKFLTE